MDMYSDGNQLPTFIMHEIEIADIRKLTEVMKEKYNYDFSNYAMSSFRRRIQRVLELYKISSVDALLKRLQDEPRFVKEFVSEVTVNVTEMFRDPAFFKALREKVVPILRTYPYVRVWNAGCSTGEETFSLAIVLAEEGLLERSRIYATDMNDDVLARAHEGAFPLEKMKRYTENYQRAGGTGDFSRYYAVDGDRAVFSASLVDGAVFAPHNLAQDGSFNEFQLVVCRNVLIYFGRPLQERVHDLFLESLARFGVLALGHKESVIASHEDRYEVLDPTEKLYRRKR